FVEPKLVAEIALRGWTGEGLVRQGSFKGLRADKPAREIVREIPMGRNKSTAKTKKARVTKAKPTSLGGDGSIEIEGVRVTHPDRVLWPGQGITKRQLIDYYLKIADRMLPQIKDRPLALVR